MTQDRDNYGVESWPDGGSGPGGPTTTMAPRDEDTWSALAHLSVYLTMPVRWATRG